MKPGMLVWFVHMSFPLTSRRVLILKRYERGPKWWQGIDPADGYDQLRVFPSECTPFTPAEVYDFIKQAK